MGTIVLLSLPLLTVLCALCFIHSHFHQDSRAVPSVGTFLPWVGGALRLFRNGPQYLQQCMRNYGPNFSIKVAGKDYIYLSDVVAVGALFRNRSRKLCLGDSRRRYFRALGGVKSAHAQSVVTDTLIPIVMHGNTESSLIDVMPTFNEELFSKLHEMAFLGNTKPTSLSQLTHCTIYNAYTRAIFGASFPVSTYQDFDYVDRAVHMLFLPLPSFVSPAHRARARLLRAFADYMKPWKETAGNRDVPNVSQQGNQIIRALVKSGLSDLDNAGLLQAYLWGAITNVVHITFWSIAHLMCDRTALDAVRKDVDETCEREFDDLNTLLGATPAMLHKSGFRLLDSLFKEAGRLHLLPTSVREVSDDVDIPLSSRGAFRAKRGSAVVVNIPAIHRNEEYFPDAESFRVDRFLDGESTKYLYVWGKGEHMCPGRHVATYMMKIFIIELFCYFDFEPVTAEPMIPKEGCYNLSVMHPKEDLMIYMRKRQTAST